MQVPCLKDDLQILLPLFVLFFHFLDGVLCHTKVFNFDVVQLTFLFCCAFDVVFKIPLPNPRS